VISTVAGTGTAGDSGDGGPAREAKLNSPFGVVFDRSGHLFIADTFNHRVRRVDARIGLISTLAGTGEKGFAGDDGPATAARLNEPYGLAVDRVGNLFVSDRLNHRIRRVDTKTGTISTVAGPDTEATLAPSEPSVNLDLRDAGGIALDDAGQLLIADVASQRVWKLDPTRKSAKLFAGNGRKQHSGDGGLATEAGLLGPRAIAIGPRGEVLIVEREGNCVRTVDPTTGKIETIAGTGKKGFTGDGGPAKDATFDGPKELAIDSSGNIFVVDTENHAIRRIDARSGNIATVAGTGHPGTTGDGGLAEQACLSRPHGVAIRADGAILIGDTNNHRVRKVGKK
jgi:sugar lactone lactonase YvrE